MEDDTGEETEERRMEHEVIPSAKRLIISLRDEGYDFVTAAADIIDNSIQAGATEIDVRMEFNGETSWFLVADNGKGMSPDELTEAMRFGTKREYKEGELGKFGLGMKTASISQCRKLTVASRKGDSESDIGIRQLNLDQIEKTDRWVIQSIPVSDYSSLVSNPLKSHKGTVILWENLDRMMSYDPPDGTWARNGFLKMERALEKHLSMVFHRFLSGELGPDRKVVIRMEGNPIKPWDPFARDEDGTMKFEEKTIAVPGSDKAFKAHYTAYLLPTKAKFLTPSAWSRAAGPLDWNAQQGFYIYREDRLIQSGGWCRMRTADEHTKYARIALDLHTDADFTLGLNIMKSSVVFPPVMKGLLKKTVEGLCSLARKKYTPDIKDTPPVTRNPSNNTGQKATEEKPTHEPDKERQNFKDDPEHSHRPEENISLRRRSIAEALEDAASKIGESPALQRIKDILTQDDPVTASAIGW
ncbi:MAG: ATP-binding protein [Thermoplasmataceae archaeon]